MASLAVQYCKSPLTPLSLLLLSLKLGCIEWLNVASKSRKFYFLSPFVRFPYDFSLLSLLNLIAFVVACVYCIEEYRNHMSWIVLWVFSYFVGWINNSTCASLSFFSFLFRILSLSLIVIWFFVVLQRVQINFDVFVQWTGNKDIRFLIQLSSPKFTVSATTWWSTVLVFVYFKHTHTKERTVHIRFRAWAQQCSLFFRSWFFFNGFFLIFLIRSLMRCVYVTFGAPPRKWQRDNSWEMWTFTSF